MRRQDKNRDAQKGAERFGWVGTMAADVRKRAPTRSPPGRYRRAFAATPSGVPAYKLATDGILYAGVSYLLPDKPQDRSAYCLEMRNENGRFLAHLLIYRVSGEDGDASRILHWTSKDQTDRHGAPQLRRPHRKISTTT